MDEALLQFYTSLDRSLFLDTQYKGLAKLVHHFLSNCYYKVIMKQLL